MQEKKSNLVSRSTARKIYNWCVAEYGRSKLNGRYPNIAFRKGEDWMVNHFGHYDKEEQSIFLNKDANLTLEALVRTIIHEYTHHVKHSMREYDILAKYLSYDKHPLEIDARKVERRDYKKCLRYLKEQYNILE